MIDVHGLEAAEEEIRALLEKGEEGRDADALAVGHLLKAYLHSRKGEMEETVEALKAHLELNPKNYEAWNNMGNAFDD